MVVVHTYSLFGVPGRLPRARFALGWGQRRRKLITTRIMLGNSLVRAAPP